MQTRKLIIILIVIHFVGCSNNESLQQGNESLADQPKSNSANDTNYQKINSLNVQSDDPQGHPDPETIEKINSAASSHESVYTLSELTDKWASLRVGEDVTVRGTIAELSPNNSWLAGERAISLTLHADAPTSTPTWPSFVFTDIDAIKGMTSELEVIIRGTVAPAYGIGEVRNCQIIDSGEVPKAAPKPPRLLSDKELEKHLEAAMSLSRISGIEVVPHVNGLHIQAKAVGEDGHLLPQILEELKRNHWIEYINVQSAPTNEIISDIAQAPGLKILCLGEGAFLTEDDYSLKTVSFIPLIEAKQLTSLRIESSHGFNDTHLNEIGRFHCLRELLVKSVLFGQLQISDIGLKGLTNLHSLRWLELPEKSGDIDVTITDEGIANLGKCKRLNTLKFWSNFFTGSGLRGLSVCSKLHEIVLLKSSVNAEELQSLKHIKGLKTLDLSRTKLGEKGIFEYLSGHPSLELLDLSNTQLGDVGVKLLVNGEWPNLSSLRISDNDDVTDEGAKFLLSDSAPAFNALELGRTRITDLAISSILTSSRLAKLDLEGCNVSDGGIEQLVNSAPLTLESLNLYGTKVTDQGARKLSTLTSLRTLSLPDRISVDVKEMLRESIPEISLY